MVFININFYCKKNSLEHDTNSENDGKKCSFFVENENKISITIKIYSEIQKQQLANYSLVISYISQLVTPIIMLEEREEKKFFFTV